MLFPCQPQQTPVHSNWKDGFLSLEESMQLSVSHTEFGYFTSGDINSKYNIISQSLTF